MMAAAGLAPRSRRVSTTHVGHSRISRPKTALRRAALPFASLFPFLSYLSHCSVISSQDGSRCNAFLDSFHRRVHHLLSLFAPARPSRLLSELASSVAIRTYPAPTAVRRRRRCRSVVTRIFFSHPAPHVNPICAMLRVPARSLAPSAFCVSLSLSHHRLSPPSLTLLLARARRPTSVSPTFPRVRRTHAPSSLSHCHTRTLVHASLSLSSLSLHVYFLRTTLGFGLAFPFSLSLTHPHSDCP